MTAYFFDSSAIIKRYINEIGTDWVRSTIKAKSSNIVYISRITVVEVCAAITRHHKKYSPPRITKTEAQKILRNFDSHLKKDYRILEVSLDILSKAKDYAKIHGLKGYDTLQLTFAIEINNLRKKANLGNVTFVAADKELADVSKTEKLTFENPNSPLRLLYIMHK